MIKISPGFWPKILCGNILVFLCFSGASTAIAHYNIREGRNSTYSKQFQTENTIDIPGQPLQILVGLDGSLQVYHEKYSHGATFGNAGSGFFIAIGEDVYGPGYTPFLISNQSAPAERKITTQQVGLSGNGTSEDPYEVITEMVINTNESVLGIIQTIQYINGKEFFQEKWEISNYGRNTTCLKAYHAADLYFANNDYGYGYYHFQTMAVGGYNQDHNWFMVFIPEPRASHYEEAYYSTIWERVSTSADLQDSIDPDYIDNGAALQWDLCLQDGQTNTIGDQWSFGESETEVIHPGEQKGGNGGAIEPFREAGLLTPEITTYIPTPLDVSSDPKVIGTNLLIAALAMIIFTAANEVLDRTLAKNEHILKRFLKPIGWIHEIGKRASLDKRVGHPLWFEILKLIIVVLIYGFVFSLLDPSWNPLSLTGLYLFFTMAVAYGFVGLADDIVQWVLAKRWKVASSLNISPGNLAIIVASTLFSRIFGIVPGIMFGMPEAFQLDESTLKNRRTENRLLGSAAAALIIILLVAWLPTTITALILRTNLPQFLLVLTGGLESFLLLIFAVTAENIFLQMLNLPDSFGHALARWNKVAWAAALLVATFLFLHTLINPRGDLIKALATTNIRFFLITIFLFLVFCLAVWLFFLIFNVFSEPEGISRGRDQIVGWFEKKKNWWIIGIVLLGIILCICAILVVAIYISIH